MTFRRVAFTIAGALGLMTTVGGLLTLASLALRWLNTGQYDLFFALFILPNILIGGWMGHEHWRERVLAGKEDAE